MPTTSDGRLADCPGTPNCVCSDAGDARHRIAPLETGERTQAVWQTLVELLAADPACTIVERGPDYLHAEARTRWLRFVDDVEFHLRADEGRIAMRSASRVGYSDLGTNRRRLEGLRRVLEARSAAAAQDAHKDAP